MLKLKNKHHHSASKTYLSSSPLNKSSHMNLHNQSANDEQMSCFFTPHQVYQMLHSTHEMGMNSLWLHPQGIPMELYKGLFMKESMKKKFDFVKYWFNFYGSHINKNSDKYKEEIEKFISSLHAVLHDLMGVVHGGGQGLMKIASDAAKIEGVFSAGVMVDLKKTGQDVNFDCDGIIGYTLGNRLERQQYMDALGNISIFNMGGFGTLEELCITLTSYKTYEKALAPIIIVDCENVWAGIKKQIFQIVENQLGPSFPLNLVVPCSNYTEAKNAILQFLKNPLGWYEEHDVEKEDILKAKEGAYEKAKNYYLHYPEVFESGYECVEYV